MKLKGNNSGFALLLSLLVTFFLSILLMVAVLRSQMQLNASNQLIASQQALYAAEAGIELAVNEYGSNPDWASIFGTVYPALQVTNGKIVQSYRVETKNTTNYKGFTSVLVESKGTGTYLDQTVTRAIKTQMIVVNPTQFFASTPGELHVGSGSNIQSDIQGKDVYFDTSTPKPGDDTPQITVNGNVYYSNTLNGYPNGGAVSITSGSPMQFPTVALPGVDINNYSNLAQNQGGLYVDGDLTVDSSNINSLKTSNGLVYATGNITISGQVQSSMLFVAGKDIYINNDVTSQSNSGGAAPQIGLIANQDVIIPTSAPSDININAYIVAGGNEVNGVADPLGGVFTAQGTTQSKGTLNFTGAISVQGNGVASAISLNVFQTRKYTYQKSTTIPFISNIVNIVSWREISLADTFQDPTP